MKYSLSASVALVLLCASAAAASRFGVNEVLADGAIGRDLLQRTLDCSKVHAGCQTCRNQRKPGTRVSELVCSTCKAGFRLRRDGTSKHCDCAPGFYLDGPLASGGTCAPCPVGSYCPGYDASISPNPNNQALSCGTGLATIITGAKSNAQCFTVAGYGRVATRGSNGKVTFSATACPEGTYNVGSNTAGCQKCAPGLTTADDTTTKSSDCLAPAGSYMDKGIGKLCPKGTYSIDLNSEPACTACDPGVTTAEEGSTSADACTLAKPGFYMDTTSTAAPCPVNFYNDKELAHGATCTACPHAMRTKAEGADGEALCLAPPGYELTEDAAQNDGPITECAQNYFKVDWNRNRCQYCGDGIITLGTGSVSKDACLVPAGSGLVQSGANPSAAICSANSYGVDTNRPVSVAARCVTCPPDMFTMDTLTSGAEPTTTGYTDQTDCKVAPGYGLTASGLAEKCPQGTWNDGLNRKPCQPCPAGYTTVGDGKDSEAKCVVQPGWEMRADGVHPCDIGSFSTGGTEGAPNAECQLCSAVKTAGYWTQTDESTSADDCHVCAPGYGGTGCQQCNYNTFSFGGNKEGDDCTPCASGTVSARRATESARCYPQFIDATRDVFSVDEAAWSTAETVADVTACQDSCRTSTTACITYRYDLVAKTCQLLLEQTGGGATLGFKINNGVDNVMYEIPTTWDFGVPVGTDSIATEFNDCPARCKASNDCEAWVFVTSTNMCGLRSSELDEQYQGMFHVRGDHLMSDLNLVN